MKLIKNRTPFLGKIKLKFEKNPHHSSSNSVLNYIHLNLGFTKLVSRLEINQIKRGDVLIREVDPTKVEIINSYTGGTIVDTYKFTDGTGYTHTLVNMFVNKNNDFIGSIEDAWWFVTNHFKVCNNHPHGVAIQVDPTVYFSGFEPISKDIIGYYGYTHRGGSLFKIGDRIFDAEYKGNPDDYTKEQWSEWEKAYTRSFEKSDGLSRKWLLEDGITSFIPFNLRGSKIIQTWTDAEFAAKNLSEYL